MIGLLIGVVFLSRMDGIFVGMGVVIALCLRKLSLVKRKRLVLNLRLCTDLMIIILLASLTVLPWVGWNLLELERLTPISGESLRVRAWRGTPYIQGVTSAISVTCAAAAKFFLYPTDPIQKVLTLLIVLVAPVLIMMLKKRDFNKSLMKPLDFLVISSVLYFSYYWLYQLRVREWYMLYLSFLLTIMFSFTAVEISEMVKYKKIAYFLIVCTLSSAFIFSGVIKYAEGNAPQERLKWEIANYIDENIPADETIASFNTGIYQYYTKNHDVINLDGVINPEALQSIKDSSIEIYILRKNISYIVDPPKYVEGIDRSILDLKPLKTFEMPYYSHKFGTGTKTYKIFKVVPAM